MSCVLEGSLKGLQTATKINKKSKKENIDLFYRMLRVFLFFELAFFLQVIRPLLYFHRSFFITQSIEPITGGAQKARACLISK